MKRNVLLGLALVIFAPVSGAYGQAAGNVGKPQAAQMSPTPGNTEGAYENQQRYFDQNQLAKGYRNSAGREDQQGTKNKKAGKQKQIMWDPTIDAIMGGSGDPSGAQYYNYRKQSKPMMTPVEAADEEAMTKGIQLPNTLITDSGLQAVLRHDALRSTEMAFDPERLNHTTTASAGMAAAGASNSSAGVAEQSFDVALQRIVYAEGSGALINVANEASGTGGNHGALFRTIPDAVGMVQKMYKNVFVPMAILFLLPGAVISQVKGLVGRGLGNTVSVPESQHPFDGILRSIVAVFLIPATQVFMSWSIDTGNSMAWSVRDWVEIPRIIAWAHQLSYNPQNFDNVIKMPQPKSDYAASGGGGGGGGGGTFAQFGSQYFGAIGGIIGGLLDAALGGINAPGEGSIANMSETKTHFERQGYLDIIFQLAFNYMMYIAAFFIIILSAYQVAMICYLYLMGPLAAAFYAWPQVNQGNNVPLFRGVFGNWLEAVIKVSMWRFFWMVVLAVVTQRLIYTGGGTSDLQWEVCMFASFLGIMLYVPQQPFNFAPAGAYGETASVYQAAMQQAQQQAGSSGGGGKGGGGGSASQAAAPGSSSSGAAPAGKGEEHHDTKSVNASPDAANGQPDPSGGKSLNAQPPAGAGSDKPKTDSPPVAPPPTAPSEKPAGAGTGDDKGHGNNGSGPGNGPGSNGAPPSAAPAVPAAAPASPAPAAAAAPGGQVTAGGNLNGAASATANGIAAGAAKGGPPVGLSPSAPSGGSATPGAAAGGGTQVVQAPPSATPAAPAAPASPAAPTPPPAVNISGGGGAASASADIGNKTKDDLNK